MAAEESGIGNELRAAFDGFVVRFHRRGVAHARSFLGQYHGMAEDAFTIASEKLWDKLLLEPHFRTPCYYEKAIWKFIQFVCLELTRTENHHSHIPADIIGPADHAELIPSAVVEWRELLQILPAVVNELPREQRDVLV